MSYKTLLLDIADNIANNYLRAMSLYVFAGGAVVFLFALMCLAGQTGRNGSAIGYMGFICFTLAFVIYLSVGTPDLTSSSIATSQPVTALRNFNNG